MNSHDKEERIKEAQTSILNKARDLHFEDCFYRTHHGKCSCPRGVVIDLLIAERCAVRVLLMRLERCEGSRRVHELDNHHNALACGYCSGPLKDELLRLQSDRTE